MNRQEHTLVLYTAHKAIVQKDFANYFKLSRLSKYALYKTTRAMALDF